MKCLGCGKPLRAFEWRSMMCMECQGMAVLVMIPVLILGLILWYLLAR